MLQITVDEKGLAAIFVFGLQGYKQSGIGQRCLMAAMELVNIMQDGGVPSHVGMDLGSCFCGRVGDHNWRCEFSVVGGAGRLLTPSPTSRASHTTPRTRSLHLDQL